MAVDLRTALPALVLALVALPKAHAAPQTGFRIAVEVETLGNTPDGCASCGCRVQDGIAEGKRHTWWVSFGEVAPRAEKGWEPVASGSHCGIGSFEKVGADFARTVGTPYVVVEVSTTPAATPSGSVDLNASMRVRRLTAFDAEGRPKYEASTLSRPLRVMTEGSIVFPLLIPDARERDAFAVDEVFVRLHASILGRAPAAYGLVSVTADVPGAEILLDGGFAGRVADEAPTILPNVVAGNREIRVRDFSGREASKRVAVEKDATVEVTLNVLDLASAGADAALIPIGKNKEGQDEYWRLKDRAIVARVPAGEFLMGSPESEGEPHERPRHRVFVSEFLVDKTEVTWRQFRKFSETTGTPLPPPPLWGVKDDYAATNVLWDEARAYCEWAGGRLPTEAEWEKAARGTDGRTYSWGNDWEPDRCVSRDGGPHRPESAGSYRNCVTPYGLLDMPGGVWEWTADGYGETYYAESPQRDPKGPGPNRYRVMRGGSWMTPSWWLRVAFRYKGDSIWRNSQYGFRCAMDAGGRP